MFATRITSVSGVLARSKYARHVPCSFGQFWDTGTCSLSRLGLSLPSPRRCISNTKDSNSTESNEIMSSKDLRRKLKEHIGARSYWLDNKEFQGQDSVASRSKRVISQDELEVRHMKDSYQEVLIPLGKDLAVRDKYLTFFKTVRVGKLLEDVDTMAGWVGFKFYKGPPDESRPTFGLVTACVDKFDLSENMISAERDIKLRGYVSWAGRTSLEITIHIDQETNAGWKELAKAISVFVARDAVQGTSVFINKLEPQSDEEKLIIEHGDKRKKSRIERTEKSLFKVAPTAEERKIIHNLFLKTLSPTKSTFHTRIKPKNAMWMEETRLKNLIICHPQSRNMYNKIFGGFLMREAFELAWANTFVCIKSRPTVVCMDDINFRKPVEVGSLLYLSSQDIQKLSSLVKTRATKNTTRNHVEKFLLDKMYIVYTQGNYLQTRVHAEVVQPRKGTVDTTNVFHFHFTSEQEFPQVMPSTYGEYMLYLDGRRHCVLPLIDPLDNFSME